MRVQSLRSIARASVEERDYGYEETEPRTGKRKGRWVHE